MLDMHKRTHVQAQLTFKADRILKFPFGNIICTVHRVFLATTGDVVICMSILEQSVCAGSKSSLTSVVDQLRGLVALSCFSLEVTLSYFLIPCWLMLRFKSWGNPRRVEKKMSHECKMAYTR